MAFSVLDGRQLWSWSDPGHPYVGGAITDDAVAVVATGNDVGTPPAAVFPVVDHLVGLDANSGRELWSRPLPDDGQSVPAVAAGSQIVVSLADGTVLGVNPATGSTTWSDKPPPVCHLDPPAGPGVNAAVVSGGTTATIEYMCVRSGSDVTNADDAMVAAINPANGQTLWDVQPGGWSLNYQATVASARDVIAVVGSGSSDRAVADYRWNLGPVGYQSYQILGVDQTDGHALWELSGVPEDVALYAGPDQLCLVSQFGVSCRQARTGSQLWQWRPPVQPTHGSNMTLGGTAAAAGGLLYLVAPTAAAERIDTESTTQRSAPGTFQLVAMNMASGATTLTIALPAYYRGPDGVVVSLLSPPSVEALARGMVLITPQLHETDITEAFRTS